MALIKWFQGKKAYFIGLGMVCWGAYECIFGDADKGAKLIAEGLGIIALRAGIKKTEKK